MQQPCLLFSLHKFSVLGNMTSHILRQPQTSVSIIDTLLIPFEAAVV